MNLQNLFSQLTGSSNEMPAASERPASNISESLGRLSEKIPGGLVGGAAAGGIMALLIGNKPARKLAGKAAGYGGAAVLGGLAYKAYKNWAQGDNSVGASSASGINTPPEHFAARAPESQQALSEFTVIKAMVAAAKSDGHIDDSEQQRIFDAVDQLGLSSEQKGRIFDILRRDVTVQELASEVHGLEQKSELYLASCMVIQLDHPSERDHLDELASALNLPAGLSSELEMQAQQIVSEAA